VTDQGRKAAAKFERILVVDPNLASAKMLANMIRDLWPWAKIYGARDAARAMALAAEVDAQLVFVEAAGPNLDGMAFTRSYRRGDHDCREAPIIMIFADASGAQILAARDVGVHEFMRRPITMGDLQKRLDAVTGRPRDWIEAVGYVGPDRRRFNSADFKGPKKRRTDGPAKLQKMNQALRIIMSAIEQMEADPVQAARALSTQARILIELSAGQEPLKRLGVAATYMQAYLNDAAQKGAPLARTQVETYANNVLLVAPEAVRPSKAA
jgi:DNA-binding response OmpR family regulator